MRANAAENFDDSIVEWDNEGNEFDVSQEPRSVLPSQIDSPQHNELRQIVKEFNSSEIGVLLN